MLGSYNGALAKRMMNNNDMLRALALDHIDDLHREARLQRLAWPRGTQGQGPSWNPFGRARRHESGGDN
jgi:hypothetical protein